MFEDALAAVTSLTAEGRLDEARLLAADALTAVEVDNEPPALRAVLFHMLAGIVLRQGKV